LRVQLLVDLLPVLLPDFPSELREHGARGLCVLDVVEVSCPLRFDY
jgi:hypothetical protein